ncbi:MAG: metallophosphoesterase [Candidatus Micrarchaeota archaeon]
MKIAIISDCHFGFNEDALPQAREAMLQALELGADALLLPGDIYDIRIPRQETLHETIGLYSEIRERSESGKKQYPKMIELGDDTQNTLENQGIPVLAIWGTHERRSKGLTNVIQIMDAAGLLVSFHTRKIVLEKDGERICFQGLGGVPEEYFGRTLKVARFAPEKNTYNIFVFHQNLAELMPVEIDGTVAMADLPDGFELYVNGHIHWNHDLDIGGRRLLVSGSTVVTQMKKNEEKPKGFYFFDTKTQEARFVTIPSRPFYFREIKFENAMASTVEGNLDDALSSLLKQPHLMQPMLKIKMSGTIAKGQTPLLSLEKIIAKYSGNARIYVDRDFESFELKDKIETLRRLRREGKGAKELGIEILKDRLKERGLVLKDAHDLFEALADGEIELAMQHL